MNWDRVRGNWKQFRGKVRQEWGRLTDDELDMIAGKRDILAGKIQSRYGITKDDAERQIRIWERKHPEFDERPPPVDSLVPAASLRKPR